MAKVKYHKSHKMIDNEGNEYNFVTQLYQVGVYSIINNDSSTQSGGSPRRIATIEKEMKKLLKKGEIKSIEWGTPITVTDKSGFWEKVVD